MSTRCHVHRTVRSPLIIAFVQSLPSLKWIAVRWSTARDTARAIHMPDSEIRSRFWKTYARKLVTLGNLGMDSR
jgi:hypothetical protein